MRSGMVAVVGRPNVGKSTLINALIGTKVSIVSRRPQTTRHAISGVLHLPDAQIVFIDTPGMHQQQKHAINRALNRTAGASLQDADVVLFVVEAGRFGEDDRHAFSRVATRTGPTGLVLSKIDKLADKDALLAEIARHNALRPWDFVVPLSAQRGRNLLPLIDEIKARLPEGPAYYPPEQIRGYDTEFLVAELVREKLFERLREELPYALTVETEQLERDGGLLRISAVIWVERDGQKRIVIGEGGQVLKAVGGAARHELERSLELKVFLKLWVRVREGWTDDERSLRQFGISGE